MESRLRALVPELSLTAVHGRMGGDELDEAMMEFSAGDRDVLLATNIIEAGLDLPNANTMLVWRPDRFGLAQLHQLRGRVGRGRARASAYFLTDPDRPPSEAARKRLDTIAGLDSLGAGFGISLADLDQRGAGDLLGEEQAGHMVIIGTERYQDVLRRALAAARGDPLGDEWTPELVMDLPAYAPGDFIPEPDARLEVYRRLARLETFVALDEATEDLADRFGALPPPVEALLGLTRLRLLCLHRGIAAIHAGPAGVALTPRAGRMEALSRIEGSRQVKERIILPIMTPSPINRLRDVMAAIDLIDHPREEVRHLQDVPAA
jgi:transcription-repair coupling factor (superfamily II helicase)